MGAFRAAIAGLFLVVCSSHVFSASAPSHAQGALASEASGLHSIAGWLQRDGREGWLAADDAFDVLRADGGRRRARDDEPGHGARAERDDHLRADRRGAPGARIAVGERALHGQGDRDLEEGSARFLRRQRRFTSLRRSPPAGA